ncbi:LOW QUALITY PROTEIN: lysophosphatidic acid receptor 6-like [Lates calcarifer]|uniref:LOW QUALITY PROTEIN: lysophosphatidic acid receptor 6-like n=1 Tax=Lates calcarifer TaxID=8187 RepID=A0AAJ7LTW0_LATCA|nr:LOW QUALITY PROTEIN: lysophosphatidic acid receptor 6-like [Lates calcarifer]
MDAHNTSANPNQPQPVYAMAFGCIMVLGLPLNIVSLWILLRRHSLKSPTAVFMVNLAISDLLLVISLPMRVYFYATGTWPLSALACQIITKLFLNNIRSSSIFITFISVDRLLAVVYPLRSRCVRTAANAWKAVSLIWVFVAVMNIPEGIIFSKLHNNCSERVCFGSRYLCRSRSPMVYFQMVLVFLLLAVNVVCTVLVSWTLHTHLSDSVKVNNKMNVMLIFLMNLVTFTICFLPVSLAILAHNEAALTSLVCLAAVNCCLDPLLYYFSLDAFWKKKEDVALTGDQRT